MGLIWSQKEMFSHLSDFVPQDSNENMVPYPLHLNHQMYIGCEGWFSSQVKIWEAVTKNGQLCSIAHICQKWTFWHVAFFLFSTCNMCNSNSHLFALYFGPFSWQFHFKEKHKAEAFKFLLQFHIYNLVSSAALRRCMRFFDHM